MALNWLVFFGDRLLRCLKLIFPLLSLNSWSRRCPAATWRSSQKLLHGAEFPRPESCATAASEPGCSGGGRGQCWPDGDAAASLAGPAAGGSLVSCGRLLDGTQRLSRHAAMPPDRLELGQPGPQVGTEATARGWTNQVAEGGEGTHEGRQVADVCLFIFIVKLAVKRKENQTQSPEQRSPVLSGTTEPFVSEAGKTVPLVLHVQELKTDMVAPVS